MILSSSLRLRPQSCKTKLHGHKQRGQCKEHVAVRCESHTKRQCGLWELDRTATSVCRRRGALPRFTAGKWLPDSG